MNWLECFECDDRIFAAANWNKVAAKIIADVIEAAWRIVVLPIFWSLDAFDFHELVEAEVELIDEHKFAEAVIEELTEE